MGACLCDAFLFRLRWEVTTHALSQSFPNYYLADADNVFVFASYESINFSQSSDGEAIFLLVKLELLESNDFACLLVARTKDDTIGPFLDLIQALVRINGTRRSKGWMMRAWWDVSTVRG